MRWIGADTWARREFTMMRSLLLNAASREDLRSNGHSHDGRCIFQKLNPIPMRLDGGRPTRKWYPGETWALLFLLLGLALVLFVAATEGEYLVWSLWIAVPMLMFSLAYLFLVSALPIFLGPRAGGESEAGPTETEDDE